MSLALYFAFSFQLSAFSLLLVALAEGARAETADQQRRQRAWKRLAGDTIHDGIINNHSTIAVKEIFWIDGIIGIV